MSEKSTSIVFIQLFLACTCSYLSMPVKQRITGNFLTQESLSVSVKEATFTPSSSFYCLTVRLVTYSTYWRKLLADVYEN